jgi:hypothetical protein
MTTGGEYIFQTSISIAEFWTPLIGWQVDVITSAIQQYAAPRQGLPIGWQVDVITSTIQQCAAPRQGLPNGWQVDVITSVIQQCAAPRQGLPIRLL